MSIADFFRTRRYDSAGQVTGENAQLTLFADAVRAASQTGAAQTNRGFKGAIFYFNIRVVPGVDTVQLIIEGQDPVSGNFGALLTATAIAAVTTPARYVFYPGAGASGATGTAAIPLPYIWRARIVHSGAGNFTYSLAADMLA